MKITAKLKNLRISARKVRLVADSIRGKKAEEAKTILNFMTKRGAFPVLKLLNQAVANAKNNFQLDPLNLFICEIKVDDGPKLKRWRARARGQAYEIQKKTSHVSLTLEEIVKEKGKKKKKEKEPVVQEAAAGAKTGAEEKTEKKEKPKFKSEAGVKKPRMGKGITKIFRRKAF